MNNETIKTIIEWHEKTFPDATLEGQKAKFQEEFQEWSESHRVHELADMFIVACGVARFDSIVALEYFYICFRLLKKFQVVASMYVLQQVVNDKMIKNRKRIWNKTGNGTYHHENGIED